MTKISPSRRGFLLGLGASLIAPPAIVRASSLMPVRSIERFDPRFESYTSYFKWNPGAPPIDWRVLQFQDRIFWITPDEPRTIRISSPGCSDLFAAVVEANELTVHASP